VKNKPGPFVRFIAAFFGSVMISTAPGMVADLVDDEHRALAMNHYRYPQIADCG
jgi:hypothetical protein